MITRLQIFVHPCRTRLSVLVSIVLTALAALETSASAQNRNAVETMNFDQIMEIDELGRAAITIKMTFTASQFQNWQQKYGSNKSLLKRDMNKFISQYETYDWDVSEKQMSREVIVSLKAKGAVVHQGRGVVEFRIPKEWRGGERRENTFTFNYVEGIAPGVVGQFNVKLIAPQQASDFREQLSETGEKVIQYALAVPDGRQGWMLGAGIVSGAFGIGLIGMTLFGGARAAPTATPLQSRLKASSPDRSPPRKSIDPPSMSTIPLEETNSGMFVDDRASPRQQR